MKAFLSRLKIFLHSSFTVGLAFGLLLNGQKAFGYSFNEFDLRVGGYYSFFYPVGGIKHYDPGFLGGGLYSSFHLPIEKIIPIDKFNLSTRLGLIVGYQALSVELTRSSSDVQLFPVMAQFSLFYNFAKPYGGFFWSPSLKLNQGQIFSTRNSKVKDIYASQLVAGESATSSGTYSATGIEYTLGIEAHPQNLRQLALFVDVGYTFHGQELDGQYMIVKAGAAWHLRNSPSPVAQAPECKPVELYGETQSFEGEPLAATVSVIEKQSGDVVKSVETKDDGKYRIEVPGCASYIVTVKRPAYFQGKTDLALAKKDTPPQKLDLVLTPKKFQLAGVQFEDDSPNLKPASYPHLDKMYAFMNGNPDVSVAIEGHTAAGRTQQYNLKLSKARAETVKKYMVSKGILANRMEIDGFGSAKPVADNKTAAGQAKNRRVEVRVLNQ
jgi:outer membrane protein OmpA-like peptidoglycan-associated protein